MIVGSWASSDESWMWGWANDSLAPAFRTTTAQVRDAAQNAPGLVALRTASFGCAMPFASHLAIIAASKIGADGIFGGRHGGGAVFIAAMP